MKKKFTLILASMLLTMGAWAQITAVSDLNNTSAYTINSEGRGYLYYEANNGDYVTSTSHTTITDDTPTGAEIDQFAFLRTENTTEGHYYLYSIGASKFVTYTGNNGVALELTADPQCTWTLLASDSYFVIMVPGTTNTCINVTNWEAKFGTKVIGTGADVGNKMEITSVATELTLTDALDKIAAYEAFDLEQTYSGASSWSQTSVYPKGLKTAIASGSHGAAADHVGAAGHTIYKRATAVVTNGSDLQVTFAYASGNSHGLVILGVDAVSATGDVVASDYHVGFTGGAQDNKVYTLSGLDAGNYILRYYVCDKAGDHALSATGGTITVTGAKEITEAADVTTMLTSLKSNTNTYVVPFKGNGLGYYDETAVSAIVTQMDETVGETVAANTAAFVALDDAVDALPPLVPDGTFIRIKNNDGTGYLVSGTGTGITQFEAVATAASAANSVFYYTNGKLLSFANGMYIANGAKLTYTDTVGEAAGTAINFEVSQEAGKVQISFMNGSNVRYFYSSDTGNSDAGDVKAKFTTTVGYRFTIEEVTTFPVTIGTVGYATLHAPVALTVPAGVTAYTGALNDANSVLTLTAIDADATIPANTAVILEATETLEEATIFNFAVVNDVAAIEGNNLVGTTATEVNPKAGTEYTLQSHNGGGVAFKQYTGDNLTGFKAYLAVESQAQAIRIRKGSEEGTTSIENAQLTMDNENVVIYDLQGRRVEKMEKGIYIVNGKKIIK